MGISEWGGSVKGSAFGDGSLRELETIAKAGGLDAATRHGGKRAKQSQFPGLGGKGRGPAGPRPLLPQSRIVPNKANSRRSKRKGKCFVGKELW